MLHGCVVRADALVGMNAVVMDEAEIGAGAFVAASAFVRAGLKVPARSLAAGVPAKVLRELSDAGDSHGSATARPPTSALTERCHASLREVTPLAADDRARRRLTPADVGPGVQPLAVVKSARER